MAIIHVSIFLIVLCVSDGRSATSAEVSNHCVCAFNVSARDCDQTAGEYQLLKSSMMALQSQVGLQAGQLKDIVKLVNAVNEIRAENVKLAGKQKELTDENVKLRQEIATIKAGNAGGSTPSAANLKQCSRRDLNDGNEYGVILGCAFVKKRDDTVLHIVWNGLLRLTHGGPKYASCRRWFFTINGLECREPKTIDTLLYVRPKGTNVHRPAYVEGYCRGVAAGHLNVAWNVGNCPNMVPYNVGNSMTGWTATVRIIVEEVDVEDAGAAIV